MKKILFLIGLASTLTIQAQEVAPASAPSDWGHYAQFGLDVNTIGSFQDTEAGDVDFKFENGFMLGYEYRQIPSQGWGKSFGVMYHTKRDVDKLQVDGFTFDITSSPANIALLTLTANIHYRWEKFYLPFGINFTSVQFEPADTFDGSVDSKGGFGINFGLGWVIHDDWAVEYTAHSSSWTLDTDDYDYGTGTIAVATLAAKYRFK